MLTEYFWGSDFGFQRRGGERVHAEQRSLGTASSPSSDDQEFCCLQGQRDKSFHTGHRCILGCQEVIDECFYSFSSVWTELTCVYVV